MTSNESVQVLKAEARYWTLLIKYVCTIETDYLEIFAKCWKPVRFLVKYKAKDKKALNDSFRVKKINVLVKMQPFPEIWQISAEFGYFLKWVWRKFFISIWQPCSRLSADIQRRAFLSSE